MNNFKKINNHFKNRVLLRKIFQYLVAVLYKLYNSFLLKIFFNFISIKRRKLRKFERTIKLIDKNFFKVGNYFLPITNTLDSDSNFLSFGIGSDVRFECAVYDKYKTSAHCFDPTPRSQKLMKEINKDFLNYYPIGLSENGGSLTFYQTKPYSDYTLFKPNIFWNKFVAECFSIDEILNNFDIDYIDLIKLDIEGAAMESILHLCSTPERFGILVAELELMDGDINNYISQVKQLLELVNVNNYEIFRIPKKRSNFKSIEVIILNYGS